jgi:hypothetical protein
MLAKKKQDDFKEDLLAALPESLSRHTQSVARIGAAPASQKERMPEKHPT